jgi:hypothetical protein
VLDRFHTSSGYAMARCTAYDPPSKPLDGWTIVPGCWLCDADFPFATWATGAFSALAMTLAAPIRKAFNDHMDTHLCGTGDSSSRHYIGGFSNCPTARELFELLPEGEKVLRG